MRPSLPRDPMSANYVRTRRRFAAGIREHGTRVSEALESADFFEYANVASVIRKVGCGSQLSNAITQAEFFASKNLRTGFAAYRKPPNDGNYDELS